MGTSEYMFVLHKDSDTITFWLIVKDTYFKVKTFLKAKESTIFGIM